MDEADPIPASDRIDEDQAFAAALAEAKAAATAEPAPVRQPWTAAQVASLSGFLALVVLSQIASIVAPHLQHSNPALLLALNSRNRHLLLAIGNNVSPWAYYPIAAGRLLLAALVCYSLGRVFGNRAIGWFTRYLGIPRMSIERLEEHFESASWVLVPFFVGSNIVCVMAGLRPVPLRRMVALLLVGIAGRLLLFWVLASELRGPLDWFVRQTTRFQYPLIGLLLGWALLSNLRHLRRGER
jgi:membrane protein DedA with SNARE-associated domain